MEYIVFKKRPQWHQMTLEEFLNPDYIPPTPRLNKGSTTTYQRSYLSSKMLSGFEVEPLIEVLKKFNSLTATLHECDRHELYRTFLIPKKTSGYRRIDAPCDELKLALTNLKNIFEENFTGVNNRCALHHTSAFAYVKGRCAVDAVKCHQMNESRWFAKFDMKNFFGSTTQEFVMKQLAMIFPFSQVMRVEEGRKELEKAIDLAFLDGGLPQGTPISPLITNIMMIPLDFELSKTLRHSGQNKYVYTRYADDILISSKYDFKLEEVLGVLESVLKKYDAPFAINTKKTRYGSSSGSNWNLGVMLNKDNMITIGHKKKKQFENLLDAYAKDKKGGRAWPPEDVSRVLGLYSYYCSVEGHTVMDAISEHIGKKHGMNIIKSMKDDLK